IIAWQDYRNDGWDIFMFNLSNPGEVQQFSRTSSEIGTGEYETYMQTNPVVIRDRIYWRYEWWDFSEHRYFLYNYRFSDPQPRGLPRYKFEDGFPLYGLHLSEDWAAWADLDDDGDLVTPYAIYKLELKTGQESKFPELFRTPDISLDGDRLLYITEPWSQIIGEEKTWLIVYNLTTDRVELNITIQGKILDIDNPDLRGDYIVWEDSRKSESHSIWDKGNTDIYFANLKTGKLGQLTTNLSIQEKPKVQGDTIIWRDKRSGNWGLYAYSISRNKTAVLCENGSNVNDPEIYGNWVVWESGSRIYLYNLSKADWEASEAVFTGMEFSTTKKPVVNIKEPASGSEVSGTVTIKGNATNAPEGSLVKIKIDDGDWENATGLGFSGRFCAWEYEWDTKQSSNGEHTIYIRAYNGEKWSDTVSITVIVDNTKDEKSSDENILMRNIGPLPLIGYLGIVGLLVVIGIVVALKGKNTGKSGNIPGNKAPDQAHIPQSVQPQMSFAPPPTPQPFQSPQFNQPAPPPQIQTQSIPQPAQPATPSTGTPEPFQTTPTIPTQSDGTWICPNCGNRVDQEFTFCINCGHRRTP
ncbi:MAG: hypothetical protein KAU14_06175, partial [Thermoplasmata archaeon]|nr:hypothetical protein [Thermoplasmata archaeon]